MVQESIPQTGSSWAEGPVSHSMELGPRGFQEICWNRAEGTCRALWREKFLEVGGGVTMDTLVGEEGHLILNPVWDREAMYSFTIQSSQLMVLLLRPLETTLMWPRSGSQLLPSWSMLCPMARKGRNKNRDTQESANNVQFVLLPK